LLDLDLFPIYGTENYGHSQGFRPAAVTVAPEIRDVAFIGDVMIAETKKKPISANETTDRTVKKTGPTGSQKTRVETPDTDCDALNRRARELSRQVLQEPDVDNKEKILRIKTAIENGTYEIDAEAVADKLMADVEQMDLQNND